LVAFESQTLHVVAEMDLVSTSLSEFFSKSSIFDFKGVRVRGGTSSSRMQRIRLGMLRRSPHGCHITILHGKGSMILWRSVQHDMHVWAVLDVLALSSG
jgi:hypothetical protein